MHEMGITSGILAAAFESAEQSGAERITEIRISVGELTEIQEFALRFAFDSLTPGTMAEGAILGVTFIPAKSHCNDCGTDYYHDRFEMVCPECSSMFVTLLQGRELTIDTIETDEPDDPEACAVQNTTTSSPTEE